MKKFYLLIMALVGYIATSNAQPVPGTTCPGTLSAIYYTVPGTPTFCKLFIGGGPSALTGADGPGVVSLIGFNGQAFTDLNGNTFNILDASGNKTIEYNCQFILRIEIDYFVAGVHMECHYVPAAGGALPIKLSAFNGRLTTETEATLAWTSSLEENSFQYEVQRSADGKNFVTVGKIKAAGTSLEAVKYSFNDPLPANGSYWYRLNMVDIDGKTELSKVVYVNSKKGTGIVTKLFPNPFTSEVQLIGATSADLNTQGNIKVFSMTGQQIKFRIVGANAIAIDPTVPAGMYILKIKDQTLKLQKQF